MKEQDNKTIMIGFEPMQSFIESMYESILDLISDINISASDFVNSHPVVPVLDKHSQTKGE